LESSTLIVVENVAPLSMVNSVNAAKLFSFFYTLFSQN